jgi:hypothetical protein
MPAAPRVWAALTRGPCAVETILFLNWPTEQRTKVLLEQSALDVLHHRVRCRVPSKHHRGTFGRYEEDSLVRDRVLRPRLPWWRAHRRSMRNRVTGVHPGGDPCLVGSEGPRSDSMTGRHCRDARGGALILGSSLYETLFERVHAIPRARTHHFRISQVCPNALSNHGRVRSRLTEAGDACCG